MRRLAASALAFSLAASASVQTPPPAQAPSREDRASLVLSMGLRTVPSMSMWPALNIGDRIWVNADAYTHNKPARGEIMLFRHPYMPNLMTKRVIGLPGDRVQMKAGQLYLNGRKIERVLVGDVEFRDPNSKRSWLLKEYREQLPGEAEPAKQ